MDIQPIDFGAVLRSGMGLVPDYRADQQRGQLLDIQQQQANQQQQVFAAEQAKAQQEQQQAAAYQQAVAEFITNPTAQGAAQLQARFPKQADAVKTAWETKEKGARDADLREMSKIFGYLNAGAPDKAKASLQARIAADKEAGQDTSEDEQVLALIDEDPAQAKGLTAVMLSSIAGADHMSALLEQTGFGKGVEGYTLGENQVRFDGNNNVVARGPEDTEYLVIPEGGKAVPKGLLAGGGGQASGGSGGGAPRSVRNNNPGNLRDSPFTQGLPGYQGKDNGGFAIFASPDAGAQAQASLLQSYMGRGYNTVSKIISRWAPPSDGNDTGAYVKSVASALGVKPGDVLTPAQIPQLQAAISRVEGGPASPSNGTRTAQGGDPSGTLYGDPKPTAKPMTAAEKQEWGLPDNVAYKMGPEGPVLIGGQDTRTAPGRPVPDSTAKRVEGAVSIRDALARASEGFQDDFGGNTFTGSAENWLQSRLGTGTPGQRQWWADFYATDNQIRNDLFGSALTATEQAAYEATTISPRMTGKTIRDNLGKRNKIIRSALARQQKFLKANKFDPEAVDALYADDPLAGGETTGPAPVRVNSPAEAAKLKPGTMFQTPDGRVLRRK